MNNQFIEAVYQSLQGTLVSPIGGVEDAFADGMPCEQWYDDMLDAYARLCERLGTEDEDKDVEIIINSLLLIQRELCMKMYIYGSKFSAT